MRCSNTTYVNAALVISHTVIHSENKKSAISSGPHVQNIACPHLARMVTSVQKSFRQKSFFKYFNFCGVHAEINTGTVNIINLRCKLFLSLRFSGVGSKSEVSGGGGVRNLDKQKIGVC